MANKTLITDIAQKQEDGSLGAPYDIGADFADIVDGRAGGEGYTLQQFYDHYINFMKNGYFVASGSTQPVNNHIMLWFDTSQSNQQVATISE